MTYKWGGEEGEKKRGKESKKENKRERDISLYVLICKVAHVPPYPGPFFFLQKGRVCFILVCLFLFACEGWGIYACNICVHMYTICALSGGMHYSCIVHTWACSTDIPAGI